MYETRLTYSKRLLLMLCCVVFMWAVAGLVSQMIVTMIHPAERMRLLIFSALQNIVGFGGGAVVTSLFLSTRPLDMLGLNRAGTWLSAGGILLVFAVGLPFLNQVIWWNSQMHFPESLASLEHTLREWEDRAGDNSMIMLGGSSVITLVANILLVGVLTGLCEELLFRGTVQRIIGSGPVGAHMSIWITAVIFSIVHFQFFGFLPRVLLGAFFGYMFYWTGSIWVAATAHAINNSMYVLMIWLVNNGANMPDLNSFGITASGFPALACASLCLVMFVLIGLRKHLFSSK